jgi:Flp pilus assembly protein CpaB
VPKLRGLPATRTGAVALALACVAAAAIILMVALGNYRKSLNTANQQDTVLVATALIQKGTRSSEIIAQRLFRPTPILARNLTPGALTDAAALEGKYAMQNILPGQQLTGADFASSGGGLAAQLTPSQRAVSVSVDTSHGLTDVLQSGDHVDVYGSYTVTIKGDSQPHQIVKLLTRDALVLKAPGNSAAGGGGNSGSGSTDAILAVNSDDTGNLAYTADNGKVWLVLVPANASQAKDYLTTIDTILLDTHAIASPPSSLLNPLSNNLTLKVSP